VQEEEIPVNRPRPCQAALRRAGVFKRPARFSTPSSRFSSSLVAATIGNRCSFFGMIPSFFIMYFMAMGLVS
jgi:hypothetical protein